MKNIIELKNVKRIYRQGETSATALNGINLNIHEGEILVILGPSGSGKTTLLNVMSGLDTVTSGSIMYRGIDITKLCDHKITKFRKDHLGFIFQTYNLLEHLNVYENILVGAKLGHSEIDINKLIETVGLTAHRNKQIHELSGGEQQRVSIARAIAKNPNVMFCDEPTGALDEETGKVVLDTLVHINEEMKTTMIIITHNPGIALIGDRVIRMNSGAFIEESINQKRTKPQDITWG